ncbi:MAG: hypothetical protein HYS57_02830 [Parcubacteria group bacterium]|nr:hypothetical protein [Parcubacteria group bacterium]
MNPIFIILAVGIAVVVAGYMLGLFSGQSPFSFPSPGATTSPKATPLRPLMSTSRVPTPSPSETPVSERPEVVYLSSVITKGYSSSPPRITLRTKLKEGESVDITGWRIKTNRDEFVVPQAVRFYSALLPDTLEDIVLEENHFAQIDFAQSSLGKNLRLNVCTGYLNHTYRFEPALPKDCPTLPRTSYQHLAGWCQDFIEKVGTCGLADINIVNRWTGDEGETCRLFVRDNVGPNRCFREEASKPTFLRNEWRVWAGPLTFFDPDHDLVRLYNTKGQLIDEYRY